VYILLELKMLELEDHPVTMLKSSALPILMLSRRYLIVPDQIVCARTRFSFFISSLTLTIWFMLNFYLLCLISFQAVMMHLSNMRNEIVSRQASTFEDASHLMVEIIQFVPLLFWYLLLLSDQ